MTRALDAFVVAVGGVVGLVHVVGGVGVVGWVGGVGGVGAGRVAGTWEANYESGVGEQ